MSVLFCDLVASTERQQRLGDDAADEFRRAVFAALANAVDAHAGEVVKWLGDGMMVVFRDSALDSVACASQMHDSMASLGADPPALLRIGISAGESAFEDGDWYGTPVTEAARLCALASGGQTLVTDVVRVLVGSRGGHEIRRIGALTLKGIAKPVAVAAVDRGLGVPRLPRARRAARRRWPTVLIGVVVVSVVAAGAAVAVGTRSNGGSAVGAAPGYTPRVVSEPCSASVSALVSGAACGVLQVPENRARPTGRWIEVDFARYPARHGASAPPVIELATALDTAEIVDDPAQSPVRDDADLIVFGGRGLNSSKPALRCPEFAKLAPELLAHPEQDATMRAEGEVALRACHDRLTHAGIDLASYTALDEADDVVDLTRALDLPRVNLQAIWDGARVALDVARAAPTLVRSMTLVDPEIPRSSFMTNPVASLAAAFDRYAALCDADTACHRAYPDLTQSLRDAVAAQAAHPQMAIPTDLVSSSALKVTVAQPPVWLDGDRVGQGVAAALTSSFRNMGLLAAGVGHPNPTINASLALAQNFPLVVKDFAWGGFLSRMCSYEVFTRSAGSVVAAATRSEFAGYDDPAFRWTCDAWSVPKTDPAAFAPVASDTPTLVVEQQLDPRWDADSATQLRAGLSHASVLSFATLPGGALAGDFPRCYDDLRRAFVRDPDAPLDTAACAAQSPRIRFVVPPP